MSSPFLSKTVPVRHEPSKIFFFLKRSWGQKPYLITFMGIECPFLGTDSSAGIDSAGKLIPLSP